MKRLAVVVIAIVVLLLAVSAANAVTWGVPDNGEHPYVGTLLFNRGGVGLYSCSGTLISPTVMLTAGHCVESGGVTNVFTYVRFAENAMEGYYSPTMDWLNSQWILASAVIPHPQYEDFAQFPATYDIGLVILSQPVYLNTYGVLPQIGLLDTIRPQSDSFTVVGYGSHGVLVPLADRFPDDYARYKGTVRLIEVKSHLNAGMGAKFTNNPGKGNGSGGSCYGDSGGPVFHQNSNTIVAVVSWGNSPCIGVDHQFRVDTDIAQAFIRQYAG